VERSGERHLKPVDRLFLDVGLDGRQFGAFDVFELPPCELVGPFERRAILVFVREPAREVRVTSRCLRGSKFVSRRRRFRGLAQDWKRDQ
jgi:hypothetical protein